MLKLKRFSLIMEATLIREVDGESGDVCVLSDGGGSEECGFKSGQSVLTASFPPSGGSESERSSR